METNRRIYCAGPFYSPEDQFQLEEIGSMLTSYDFLTYIPHKHVLYQNYISCLKSGKKKADILSRCVFACNLYHLIELCQGVVFSLNGRVPDEGGNITAAISFIVGKPVILYKKDIRGKVAGDDNAMITGLGYRFRNTTRVKDIPKTLLQAMAEMEKLKNGYELPLNVLTAVEFGKTVQEFLNFKDASELDMAMLDEIITMCENSEWYNKFIV